MVKTSYSKKEIVNIINSVADLFGKPAQNTILSENAGKHLLELGLILRRLEDFQAPVRILDVGGGMGINLICLRRLIGKEIKLSLIDQFEEYDDHNRMGNAAIGNRILRESGISVINQNFMDDPKFPFHAESFDIITCFDVIEHLPSHPLRLFQEIKNVLTNNGVFIVGVPNAVSLHRRIKLLSGKHPYMPFDEWCQDKYFQHYREYSGSEMMKLLAMTGFIAEKTFLSLEPLATMAKNRYHSRHYKGFSLVSILLFLLYLLEKPLPNLRHTVYCVSKKEDA